MLNGIGGGITPVHLLPDSTLDTFKSCISEVCSYFLKASSDLCPVLCWINFSDTPAWYIVVVPYARRLWFVYLANPVYLHMSLIVSPNLFLPIGASVNHGALGLLGGSDSGLR